MGGIVVHVESLLVGERSRLVGDGTGLPLGCKVRYTVVEVGVLTVEGNTQVSSIERRVMTTLDGDIRSSGPFVGAGGVASSDLGTDHLVVSIKFRILIMAIRLVSGSRAIRIIQIISAETPREEQTSGVRRSKLNLVAIAEFDHLGLAEDGGQAGTAASFSSVTPFVSALVGAALPAVCAAVGLAPAVTSAGHRRTGIFG